MPFITIKNQKLFYTIQGRNDSPSMSVLLIHGAGGTHLDWPPELRRIADVTVFAIDLPGHGRSDPPGCSTIDLYADFVTSFIKTMEIERIVLIGHSMGGAIVLNIGRRALSQVAGLVLIATGARLKVDPAILDNMVSDFGGAVDTIIDFSWSEYASDDLKLQSQRSLLACDPEVLHGDFSACNNFDLLGKLDQILVPALVINGIEDRLTPLKYGTYLEQTIPDASLAPIERAGHMVMLEQPEKVAQQVHSFLQKLPSD